MAEIFLEEIYKRSYLLEQLQEISQKMQRMLVEAAEVQWNGLIPELMLQMKKLSAANPELAKGIVDAAEKAKISWYDPSGFSSIIDSELLPLIFEYVSYSCGIDVSEGRFTFRSSNTGFLTIYDSVHDLYLHSPNDPMWEAHTMAEAIWRPEMEEIHLYGVGLGYTAYQLWKCSYESSRIIIYETSEKMVHYARDYGVLSWIPQEYIDIYVSDDKEELAELFHRNTHKKNIGKLISTWMGIEYEEYDQGRLSYERMNEDACRWFHDLWMINLRENRKRADITIGDLRKRIAGEEWVVVAAGPSVDEHISFLKECKGKRRIVAVDVILKRLLAEGIVPDLVVIGDPKDQMIGHIEGLEEATKNIPCIADRIASWRYLKAYQGEVALMTAQNSLDRIGPAEDAEEGAWNIGGTVASLALEAAVRLGAQIVWMVGVDLSYPDNAQYAAGTMHEIIDTNVGMCNTESVDGGIVKTSKTFLFFLSIIERQIASYPRVRFINMSKRGAKIKGAIQG